MGLFDFGKAKKSKKQPVIMQRQYAGATKGRLLADLFDSERSADSELRPVLRVLRNRCRELSRNNEFAKRYLNLMKTNVVGDKGFTLQVKATGGAGKLDQMGNESVEKAFKKWGRRGYCTLDGKMSWLDAQKLALEGLVRDGEVFIIKHRGSSFTDSFAIEFIEPDQIDEQKNERMPNGNEVRMGVELDKYKRPVAYHMLNYHPGDYDYTSSAKPKRHQRIPADRVIHIFMPLRAGQTRGEPWMAPVMTGLKHVAAWREAAVINARVGASKMGFFTSPAGDGFVPDDIAGQVPIMDAEPGTFHQLPHGVSLEKFDPAYPSNEFESFHKSLLKGIASGLGISYTSLSNDLESTSYSSIRQGALEERDFYRDIQQFMIDHFVYCVYESWLESAMEIQSFGIPVREYERFYDASSFRPKAWNWVDPLKEMNAAVVGMKAGVMSVSDVAAQYGKDVEDLFAQIQRDKLLAEQFGVKYALEPYGATQVGIVPDVTGEDDAEVQGQGD